MDFVLAPEVGALGVQGACLVFTGLSNQQRSEAFDRYKIDLFVRLQTRYTEEMLANDPVLAGFRALHDQVGRSNRKFPSSSERMLGVFLRHGLIAEINPAVDIYNCVSLETMLSLGAHDIDKLRGHIALRMTDGGESFTPLGKDKQESIPAGEYAYVESGGEVLCRLECRQAERTKLTLDSRDCFYMVQGNAHTSRDYIMDAVDKLVELTKTYCGGQERMLWSSWD